MMWASAFVDGAQKMANSTCINSAIAIALMLCNISSSFSIHAVCALIPIVARHLVPEKDPNAGAYLELS